MSGTRAGGGAVRTSMEPESDPSTAPALVVEHRMAASARAVYEAFTERFGDWFAEPGRVLMAAAVDVPYFFEVRHEGQRYPHHGRFVELVPAELITMTWTNVAVRGAETVVSVELADVDQGCALRLRHGGFPDEHTRDETEAAWPHVLDHLDEVLAER